MLYTINKSNFSDFDTYEFGKLAPRAYFIPFARKAELTKTDCLTERYNSSMVHVLSGKWDFKFYDKKSVMPSTMNTDDTRFDEIDVPSTWQRTGYQPPVYLNTSYEFKLFPPELPEDFAAAIYRKKFSIQNTEKNYILTFLGVCACIDVYVNGKHIGYSEGSHNSAEFDITPYTVEGENELFCVVHKWSTGTYLECQDMFRENGIFRDVLLYEYEKTYVNDYEIKTARTPGGTYSLKIRTEVIGDTEGCTLNYALRLGTKTIASATTAAVESSVITLDNLHVQEWSAEIPTVYELFITLKKGGKTVSVLRNYTGFKTVEILGNIFKFNSKSIKLKGVNHHDSNPVTGYVLTAQDIEKDLRLMKEYNVNAIRTSHYPPDPMLLTLADILGFYVVDEADIETHGTTCLGPKNVHLPNHISHDLKWAPRYLDRVRRMYFRDRNHPCITMWSLGNEAGGYACQDKCNEYLKEVCPEIPVHYEGVVRTSRMYYDVASEMYTDIPTLEKIGAGKKGARYTRKPFFLCEYAHAMGVGPGNLEEYWQTIYAHENLMGACIWEFCDHSVYHGPDDAKYKYEYTYGGDHGETLHDRHFCVDGLFYPDRTPHTGAREMKAVYRPVRAAYAADGVIILRNTDYFRDTSYLTIQWTLTEDGELVKQGELEAVVAPLSEKRVSIPASAGNKEKDCHLTLTYINRENGVVVAEEQFVLNDSFRPVPVKENGKCSVTEQTARVIVHFENGAIAFNKETGEAENYVYNGLALFNQNPVGEIKGLLPNIYRAPIDNETLGWFPKWDRDKLAAMTTSFSKITVESLRDYVEVNVTYVMKSGKIPYYTAKICYKVFPDGTLRVENTLKRRPWAFNDLPRYGVTVELPRSFKNVEYYGRGPYENLCDFNAHTKVGIYKSTVAEMHEPYIMPQDNGNHGSVKYLRLTDENGDGVMIYGVPKFAFSVHDYTQKMLTEAKHREDVYNQNTTFLSIDGFQRGAGSDACGPDTLEPYRLTFKDSLSFKFAVKPITAKK